MHSSIAALVTNNRKEILKQYYRRKRKDQGEYRVLQEQDADILQATRDLVSGVLAVERPNQPVVTGSSEAGLRCELKELVHIVMEIIVNQMGLRGKPEEELIHEVVRVAEVLYQVVWETHLRNLTHKYQESEQRLLGAVVAAQENERKRLATALHDDVVQSMAGILLRIQMVRSLLGEQAGQARSELTEIEELMRKTIQTCRLVSFEMDSFWLEKAGFIPTLNAYVRDYENKEKINVALEIEELGDKLSRVLQIQLFRVVQEALQNIKKHAGATRVKICLSASACRARLSIEDNGCGFNSAEIQNDVGDKQFVDRFGLLSIEQRSKILGGRFHIRTAPGHGTTLTLEVPLEGAETGKDFAGERKGSPWVR